MKKPGAANVKRPTPMVNTSVLPPLFEAARIPIGIPTSTVAMKDVPRRSTVLGRRLDISYVTGSLVMKERPRLSTKRFVMYLT